MYQVLHKSPSSFTGDPFFSRDDDDDVGMSSDNFEFGGMKPGDVSRR